MLTCDGVDQNVGLNVLDTISRVTNAFDIYRSRTPMLRTNVHEMATRGMRQNNDKRFELQFTGKEVYVLQEILRRLAVESTNYMDVANAVQICELITDQLKTQDF